MKWFEHMRSAGRGGIWRFRRRRSRSATTRRRSCTPLRRRSATPSWRRWPPACALTTSRRYRRRSMAWCAASFFSFFASSFRAHLRMSTEILFFNCCRDFKWKWITSHEISYVKHNLKIDLTLALVIMFVWIGIEGTTAMSINVFIFSGH